MVAMTPRWACAACGGVSHTTLVSCDKQGLIRIGGSEEAQQFLTQRLRQALAKHGEGHTEDAHASTSNVSLKCLDSGQWAAVKLSQKANSEPAVHCNCPAAFCASLPEDSYGMPALGLLLGCPLAYLQLDGVETGRATMREFYLMPNVPNLSGHPLEPLMRLARVNTMIKSYEYDPQASTAIVLISSAGPVVPVIYQHLQLNAACNEA